MVSGHMSDGTDINKAYITVKRPQGGKSLARGVTKASRGLDE